MSFGIAIKSFFAALTNRETAQAIGKLLDDPSSVQRLEQKPAEEAAKSKAASSSPASPSPARNDALTLLSALQREARFLDLVQESLDAYDDTQVGAAAREVIKETRQTLDRFFAIEPLEEQLEGEPIEIPEAADPARYRLTGKSEATEGEVVHRGWQATKCEIPKWNGSPQAKLILTPCEVEGK